MKVLLFIIGFKLVTGGYLPPPDGYYDNRTPTCACDEAKMSSFAEKISQLEINLEEQRTRSEGLEKRITQHERNKRQVVDGPVAFTAYMSVWANDLTIGQPIVFDKVLTNEGGFYSTSTGKFTVPLDGLYIFSFIIETKHAVDTAVRLVVDGTNMLDAVVEPRHNEQNLQGGNVGNLKLHKGQVVWVENYNRQHQSLEGGDTYRFSTFSGALLAEMELSEETDVLVCCHRKMKEDVAKYESFKHSNCLATVRSKAETPSDTLSVVLQLSGGASVVPSTVTSSAIPSSCPSGFVQCSDGQCEPFEALCGEEGIVTVVFPTDVTTEEATRLDSASPVVEGTTIATLLSSSALMTQTSTVPTSVIPLKTTTVVVATDNSGKEICLEGWEQCPDGTCEPFHWLCIEHGGAVNFTTKTTVTTPLASISALTTENKTEVTSPEVSEIPTTIRQPFTDEVLTTTTTSQLPQGTISSGSTGSCPSGFVQCVGGNCEPFEALCGESGIVTVTFPTGHLTTVTRAMSVASTGLSTSDSMSGIQTTYTETMQTSTTFPTTTPPAIVTDSSGNEVCLKGWEQCTDGTCEPFHWMCTEHTTNTAIIG